MKIKQKVFHTMKVNNEKANEVNMDVKINVDEQHVDVRSLVIVGGYHNILL